MRRSLDPSNPLNAKEMNRYIDGASHTISLKRLDKDEISGKKGVLPQDKILRQWKIKSLM